VTRLILDVSIPGPPATQGSKRYVGNGRVIESDKRLASWRAEARHIAAQNYVLDEPTKSAVSVAILWCIARPKSHYGTGANADVVKESAPRLPTTKPDVDKVARAVLDALTSVVYVDDAQVTTLIVAKAYGSPETFVKVMERTS